MRSRQDATQSWPHKIVRGIAALTASLGLVGMLGVGGCLTRPVVAGEPTLKTNVTIPVKQSSVDKVDLLFMIDNSESMGDKQKLLKEAVPDLITRLVTPNCVDDVDPTKLYGPCIADNTSGECKCTRGSPEFPPVHDMHIGIVTSSLGNRGGDQCPDSAVNHVNAAVSAHNNDNGELINRSDPASTEAETPVTDANPSNFLAWLPPVAANRTSPKPPVPPITAASTLGKDFQDMVSGVHEYGCGLESQDEAWYRFLIQPDPYDHISRDAGECAGGAPSGTEQLKACLVGIDKKILQQRRDFLRPDSLVAIIMVTDENSSESADPLSIGGQGWAYESDCFPFTPYATRTSCVGPANTGTSACGLTPVMGPNPGPNDPACTSCGFLDQPAVVADRKSGGNCSKNLGGFFTPSEDAINLRGVNDKQRFGVDPAFPIGRYVNGLKSANVADRTSEHSGGSYVDPIAHPTANHCTNPLFAKDLPTDPGTRDPKTDQYPALCNLTRGPRTTDLVFLAGIVGVPHQLLQVDPKNPDSPQKDTLTAADWTKILGADPEHYDYTGIDPHMFVSVTPRAGLPPPSAGNGSDPDHGREWNTGAIDQQYVCTFPLGPNGRDCSGSSDVCDCGPGKCDTALCAANPTDPACDCPPLCDPKKPTTQILAKAYPSPRELQEVKALGTQGIVSSLCPIHTTEQMAGDPLYGYRPAVEAIVNRLKNALANSCLPQKLTPGPCGNVECLVLEIIDPAKGLTQDDCSNGKIAGVSQPDPQVLDKFRTAQGKTWVNGQGPDPATAPICQITQLVPPGNYDTSCSTPSAEQQLHYVYPTNFPPNGDCAKDTASTDAGWCYVQGAAAGNTCRQAIHFSPAGNPKGAVTLQCIETSTSRGSDAGGGG